MPIRTYKVRIAITLFRGLAVRKDALSVYLAHRISGECTVFLLLLAFLVCRQRVLIIQENIH
jgi:hypothetical protein